MFQKILILLVFQWIGEMEGYRKVCYYTGWSSYRPSPATFTPENIDPSLCTHLIYAFAKTNGIHMEAASLDEENSASGVGNYERFTNLKQSNPNVKFMLSLGGYTMGSVSFSNIVSTPQNQQAFATDAIDFLRKRNFDGLDIDWEYPTIRGSGPEDKEKFVSFLQTLNHAFESEGRSSGRQKLVISVAMSTNITIMVNGYDIEKISRQVDFINLMTYDFHGHWENRTGHNSPLHAHASETGDDALQNVEFATNYFIRKGAPPSKINMGIPIYARTYTLRNVSNNGLYAPTTGPGNPGIYTKEGGFLAYFELCQMARADSVHVTEEQGVSYLVLGDQWISFDDPTSVRAKTDYIKANHLGGSMVWALDLDDFQGTCGRGQYPILKLIDNQLDDTGSANAIGK